MAAKIQVKVGGRGTVTDGDTHVDEQTVARCDLCGTDVDAVASVTTEAAAPFACKACLRTRLEAITVALWQLKDGSEGGLPWGKISG